MSAASESLVFLLGWLPRSLRKRLRNRRPTSNKVVFFILLCATLGAANDQVTPTIIVVNSQDQARRALEQLQPGADFGTLTKKLSTPPRW